MVTFTPCHILILSHCRVSLSCLTNESFDTSALKGSLINDRAVCQTLVPLSLPAIRISSRIVSYHNVILEQILPYKEACSPFISPQGQIVKVAEAQALCSGLGVYYRIWKQGCITVLNNLHLMGLWDHFCINRLVIE